MLEVENTSPFTRGFHVNGREFIFKANEIRIVPDYFMKDNGSIYYAGLLKLKRIIDNKTGESNRPYIRRDENYVNPNQDWEYVFISPEGKEFVTTKVTEFCDMNKLNPTSVRVYIKSQKPYKGWMISRRKLGDSKND